MSATHAPRINRTDAADRLLNATSEILAERDTLEISVAEISMRSGLNHGLVRYYFNGKEGLLLALLKRDAEIALENLRKLVETPLPPMRKLERHIRGVVRTYFRYPYINPLINYLQQSNEENAGNLAEVFVQPLHRYQALILDEALRAGDIKKIDSRFFYFATIGACDQIFKSRRMLKDSFGIDELSSELIDEYGDFVFDLVTSGMRVGDR